jgi:hypothetical protein
MRLALFRDVTLRSTLRPCVLLGLAAAVIASELPTPLDPGAEVRYFAGFDSVEKAGIFQEVREDGSFHELDRRPGWTLQEIHALELGGHDGVLLLWKSFPLQERTSPELWVEEAPPPGFEFLPPLTRVWPRDEDPVVWHEARHEVIVRRGGARLRVARGLAAENHDAPLLRRKEVWLLTADGARLQDVRNGKPLRPEQLLNLLAEEVRAEVGHDPGRLQDLLRASARAGTMYRDRAVVEMTRLPLNERAWEASKKVLDALVLGGSPAAEWAAARLFEMVGKEWEVGRR